MICAGAPAAKWIANQNPEDDLANIERLIGDLRQVKAKRLVLISTVDVFKEPVGVDEDTVIDAESTDPYGKNRFYLEEFVREHFEGASVIRLPGLFGHGLKKNFIYDLLHDNVLHLTHNESVFQFYGMKNLWANINLVLESGIPLINFATQPVVAKDVALNCYDMKFDNVTSNPPANYDMRTKYGYIFGSSNNYTCSADSMFEQIREFVEEQKRLVSR